MYISNFRIVLRIIIKYFDYNVGFIDENNIIIFQIHYSKQFEMIQRGANVAGVCPENLSKPAADWSPHKREMVNGNMATVCPLAVSKRRDVT